MSVILNMNISAILPTESQTGFFSITNLWQLHSRARTAPGKSPASHRNDTGKSPASHWNVAGMSLERRRKVSGKSPERRRKVTGNSPEITGTSPESRLEIAGKLPETKGQSCVSSRSIVSWSNRPDWTAGSRENNLKVVHSNAGNDTPPLIKVGSEAPAGGDQSQLPRTPTTVP